MRSVSLPQAVGEFLTEFRGDHGLTLDAIAREARRFGAKWGPASVRNIQEGRSALSLSTLIYLGLALNTLTGQSLNLAQMLGRAEALDEPRLPIEGASLPVSREWLADVLQGAPVKTRPSDFVGGMAFVYDRLTSTIAAISESGDPLPPDLDLENVAELEPTLAERRAAEKLGVGAFTLAAWCRFLWSQSLDSEALARAGLGSSPQQRGAVTRVLLQELHTQISGVNDG